MSQTKTKQNEKSNFLDPKKTIFFRTVRPESELKNIIDWVKYHREVNSIDIQLKTYKLD